MLDLDYIKDNTLWVVRYENGRRITVKGKEVDQYNSNDIKEKDTVIWKNQPTELQNFYYAYEYALNTLDRSDLFYIDDFYKAWSKDPNQFKEEKLRVPLGESLQETLDEEHMYIPTPQSFNVEIINYDKRTIGNHSIDAWRKALRLISEKIDVIYEEWNGWEAKITIQCDDDELLDKLSFLSNRVARDIAFSKET